MITNDLGVTLFTLSESLPVEAKVPWLKQAHELEEHHTATEEPTYDHTTTQVHLHTYTQYAVLLRKELISLPGRDNLMHCMDTCQSLPALLFFFRQSLLMAE